MSIQFLPQQQNPMWESLGNLSGLLLGLGGGYALKQHNLGKQAQALQSLGVTSQEANMISILPPALQQQYIKDKMRERESSRQSAILGQALGFNPAEQIPQPMQNTPIAQPQIQSSQQLEQLPYEDRIQRLISAGLNPQLLQLASNILGKAEKNRLEERKFAFEQEKESKKDQAAIDKETKPFYDKVKKEAHEAKKNTARLDRMETLIKKGNLTGPLTASILESVSKGIFGYGIDLFGLVNADSQEFRKLQNDFVKSAKQYFGAKLTDTDLKMFMATTPNLLQNDESKLRVINNLRILDDMVNVTNRAMTEIIKENGGRRPRDIEEQVEMRAGSIIDNLADQFKKGVRGETPEQKVELIGLKPEEIISTKRLLPFQSPF